MTLFITYALISIFLFSIFKQFLLKKKFLIENIKENKHKLLLKNINKKPKLYLGGLYLLITSYFIILNHNEKLIFCFVFIFLVGLASDLNLLNSPIKRFFLQILAIFFLLFISNTLVEQTRIEVIDNMLSNFYFKIIFTSFCFLVLINGFNFIDGTNLNLIIYSLIVIFYLFILSLNDFINFDINLYFLIFSLILLACYNFNSSVLMGDAGAYLVGIIFGYFSIFFANSNTFISPIYILNLLWYPAFENLFSIIRKKFFKIKVSFADNCHLHHLIYKYLNKKFKQNSRYNNSLTGIVINSYNFIFIGLSTLIVNHSVGLSMILLMNIIFYFIIYNFLYNHLKHSKLL